MYSWQAGVTARQGGTESQHGPGEGGATTGCTKRHRAGTTWRGGPAGAGQPRGQRPGRLRSRDGEHTWAGRGGHNPAGAGRPVSRSGSSTIQALEGGEAEPAPAGRGAGSTICDLIPVRAIVLDAVEINARRRLAPRGKQKEEQNWDGCRQRKPNGGCLHHENSQRLRGQEANLVGPEKDPDKEKDPPNPWLVSSFFARATLTRQLHHGCNGAKDFKVNFVRQAVHRDSRHAGDAIPAHTGHADPPRGKRHNKRQKLLTSRQRGTAPHTALFPGRPRGTRAARGRERPSHSPLRGRSHPSWTRPP